MIWVIGDVHGMFDPLKRIIVEIRLIEERTGERVDRIVLLGDYIGGGPSSGEVLGLVRDLDFPKAPLMGDREDEVLRAAEADVRGPAARPGARGRTEPGRPGEGISRDHPERLGLPEWSAWYLGQLRYTHREVLRVRGREAGFTFMHGLPQPFMSVEEQRGFDTHGKFTDNLPRVGAARFLRRGSARPEASPPGAPAGSFIDETVLHGRDYSSRLGYDGEVIVHGHTPTIGYRRYFRGPDRKLPEELWPQFGLFPKEPGPPFLFSRSPGARLAPEPPPDPPPPSLVSESEGRCWWEEGHHFAYETEDGFGVEAINVDTGAAAGGSLTALGLSEACLADSHLLYLSCPAGAGGRGRRPGVIRGSVRITGLGGPPCDPGLYPEIPPAA